MPFIRENRYLVVKIKDLQKQPGHRQIQFMAALKALTGMPARNYVVVESDWPEYEEVWRMIEARIQREQARSLGASILAELKKGDPYGY